MLAHVSVHPRRAAFTLVELSIVLVILGLLVGGVLSGQSLIHAAELRAVSREYDQYKTAINAFKDKYFALPGDMNNAVRYWGAQGGGTADGLDGTCVALTAAATGTATCNGNGDGKTFDSTNVTQPHEAFRAWQHLANAGMVEGNFSGVSGSVNTRDAVIGTNVPRSKLNNVGWSFYYFAPYAVTDMNFFAGPYGNLLNAGAVDPGSMTDGYGFVPQDLYNIDMKLDDGKPDTGVIRSRNFNHRPNCTTGGPAYNLVYTSGACDGFFMTGY